MTAENSPQFNRHEVVWTEEKIKNFWNSFDGSGGIDYFSKTASRKIFGLSKKYLKKGGKILDYGCGEGDLIGYLLAKGITCQGLDYSEKALAKVEKKFAGHPQFHGVMLSGSVSSKNIDAGAFDFIFSIETLEHALPAQLPLVLDELFHLLKPGGYLFITVPNSEKLGKYKTLCPDCGAVFHYMQHLNSFSEGGISDLLAKQGFEKIFCRAAFLGGSQGIFHKMKYSLILLLAKLLGKKPFSPHLIYLGRKKRN
jgi:2-polyprenyl-3-methyl-5-hydroxy-6-metoxy-1,4-benzoquinol methylase